jgi:hypothetical protein
MTARELILLLQNYPASMEVYFSDSEHGDRPVTEVDHIQYLGNGPLIVVLLDGR